MRRCVTLLIVVLVLNGAASAQSKLAISLAHASPAEQHTKAQLEKLLTQYELSKRIFTKTVVVDERSIPHSHPTLTLHTRHLKDDELLLSTFVHEQLHWFVAQREKDANEAITELRRLYPKIPVGFPEGSSDEQGNYEHLVIIYLEYRADKELLGELRARQVMEFWATDHYTWLYRTILDHTAEIGEIVRKHNLFPPEPN